MGDAPEAHPAFGALLARARAATPESPLPILFSACLLGQPTGFDGSAWPAPGALALAGLPSVEPRPFCPEAHVLPTPRPWMTIHGGDGVDVLAGRAQVIDVEGTDLTDAFIAAADEALLRSRADVGSPRVAVLMDLSPSCGRNVVIYGDVQPTKAYRTGAGVVAARLMDDGVIVIAQRDFRSLALLREALDGTPPAGDDFVDHPWYRASFPDPSVHHHIPPEEPS
jgi:uncharacterized protein YbbK (DUF523 family)